jgi:hypothetical protein
MPRQISNLIPQKAARYAFATTGHSGPRELDLIDPAEGSA